MSALHRSLGSGAGRIEAAGQADHVRRDDAAGIDRGILAESFRRTLFARQVGHEDDLDVLLGQLGGGQGVVQQSDVRASLLAGDADLLPFAFQIIQRLERLRGTRCGHRHSRRAAEPRRACAAGRPQ